MKADHPWVLTAPWYRWPEPGVPRNGRASAPALQKYASPSFVTDFLKDPQRSLKFKDEDLVHRVEPKVPRPKLRLSSLVRVQTGRRKVFLDTHARFYLVVVELHCDAPGLPSVGRDQVCEAGFVVRRRVAPAPEAARRVLGSALEEVGALEAKLASLQAISPGVRRKERALAPGVSVGVALRDRCLEEIERLETELAGSRTKLHALAAAHGVTLELQGWVQSEHPGVGGWEPVIETPRELTEDILPLYPLVPDPATKKHSAAGRTIYFGVLPTGSSDVDSLAEPRFDDRHLFEFRCLVRRHEPRCPKTAQRGDCPGEPVWSRPSEVYQLANAMDLDGTSHKPVTIQMPDLPALEAQASAIKIGEGVGVRMISPNDSSLEFKSDPDDIGNPGGAKTGGPSICSFAIPLITIVATFVLKLFLPIVVFAFGLWWMLKLKFCILPSFELDADLAFQLQATPPGADVDVTLSAQIDGAFALNFGDDGAADVKSHYGGDLNILGNFALDLGSDFREQTPADVAADFPPKAPQYPPPRQKLPTVTANLEYYERVEVTT